MQSFTTYIPLSVYELESWLENPSIYVFDCSAAGMIVNALCEVKLFTFCPLLFSVFLPNCERIGAVMIQEAHIA